MKNNTSYNQMLDVIAGRKEEQQTLTKFLESPNAEFLALYGRRRIGKIIQSV